MGGLGGVEVWGVGCWGMGVCGGVIDTVAKCASKQVPHELDMSLPKKEK